MAQHKDIDKASALLEGTQGWHIINTKTQTSKRRNKRICLYYKDGRCIKLSCTYMGSSECSAYRNKKNCI